MKKVKIYGGTIDSCLKELRKMAAAEKSGEVLEADFNDKYLLSTDTDDDAYQRLLGMTKAEHEEKMRKWSEEDEKRVHRISNFIWKNRKGDTDEIYQQEQDVNWIKSLKGRVRPKQEWSKEDETKMRAALAFIKSEFPKEGNEEIMEDTIEWLKSLRPQKQWKPSEEQIKILNEILNFAANHESPYWNDYIFGTLNNLIRQLKKLIE